MSSPVTPTRIALIGHLSAGLDEVAARLPDRFVVTVAHDDQLSYEFPEFSAVILAVSAASGAPNTLIPAWEEISEFQIPRAIIITKIEEDEADFDEAILIVRRMFGEGVTPYLVLHADDGTPCAFIDLENMNIRDYSTGRLKVLPSEEEHRTLVKEFREEYLEAIEGLDEPRFATGLFVPILPFSSSLHLGEGELISYLDEITEN